MHDFYTMTFFERVVCISKECSWKKTFGYQNLVFCYQNCCPTVRKKYFIDQEKLLKFEAEGREFAKCLRSLNRTIYSNSKRSEQF